MKIRGISLNKITAVAIASLAVFNACKSNSTTPPETSTAYQATYLVADTAGFGSARIDPNLVNGWGIAVGSSGTFWVSSNHGGVSTVYSGTGAQQIAPVTIPSRDTVDPGAPSGQIFNPTTDFNTPSAGLSKFIFAGEDGTISGWNGGPTAKLIVTDPSSDAVYKGIVLGSSGGNNYLYVTDFKESKMVVYDKNFKVVTGMPFSDPGIPSGYGPFGISNINGQLYVTYAEKKAPDFEDDQAGAGLGYVDIYTTAGVFVKRFASGGLLNSPWAVVKSPANFGTYSNDILVGNFGDGTVTVYDSTGTALGQLGDGSGNTLSVGGLWGLVFTGVPNDSTAMYFAGGPYDENHGTFGYIKAQ